MRTIPEILTKSFFLGKQTLFFFLQKENTLIYLFPFVLSLKFSIFFYRISLKLSFFLCILHDYRVTSGFGSSLPFFVQPPLLF